MQFDELPAEALPCDDVEALPLPEAELLELGVAVAPVAPLPAPLPLFAQAAHSNAAAAAALIAFKVMDSSWWLIGHYRREGEQAGCRNTE